jgi:ketosteroid isomerase-like protein
MSAAVDPRALTLKFNERINNRDVDGLAALMTDDHTFIDTSTTRFTARRRASKRGADSSARSRPSERV